MFSIKTIDAICPHQIYAQIKQHKLVKIRKELNTKEDFVTFAQTLGQLYAWSFGVVNELKIDKNSPNYLYSEEAVPFHWDGAFAESPHLLLFYCIASCLDNAGGETLFVDSEALLASFDAKQYTLLQQMEVTYETEKLAHYGGSITQKIIDIHPYTKKPILRFAEAVFSDKNPVYRKIKEVTDEKLALISLLEQRLYQQEYCYAHTWQSGELIIADNFALLHGRNKLKNNTQRHIRRIQIL
jgi:alpha-ketoglutarate-dependent taurine dioxygenase